MTCHTRSAPQAYLATFANALFTDSSSRTYRWGLMLDAGRSRQGVVVTI